VIGRVTFLFPRFLLQFPNFPEDNGGTAIAVAHANVLLMAASGNLHETNRQQFGQFESLQQRSES
jgi:hypothetical protein